MRHRKKGKILDRPKGQREALLRTLATQLILYEKIVTTQAKAKALRRYVERLVSRSLRNTLTAQRYVAAQVNTDGARRKLFEVLRPRYENRHGGYLRLLPLKRRVGDGAQIVRVELV